MGSSNDGAGGLVSGGGGDQVVVASLLPLTASLRGSRGREVQRITGYQTALDLLPGIKENLNIKISLQF